MRFYFRYDCEVAVVLPDGTLTTMLCLAGEAFDSARVPQLVADIQSVTIELADGMTLVNVPVEAVAWESMNVDCI